MKEGYPFLLRRYNLNFSIYDSGANIVKYDSLRYVYY